MSQILHTLTCLLLGTQLINAAVHRVQTVSAFNQLTLAPGDEVIWEDGTYSANMTLNFLANGTAEAPVILRAETPGGVVFTGDIRIFIGGNYLIVDGFHIKDGRGQSSVVEFRRSGSQTQLAQNSILRNCAIDSLVTEGDSKSSWTVLYGENNIIENCSYLNKNSTGEGILVEVRYQGDSPASHIIRNNHFYNFPRKDGRANDNDSEVIRIGVSSYQTVDSRVIVEGNYFVETNGENEIISNKSRNNIYRHNTFRRCRGALVLRHGSGARVEGNFFIGEGVTDSGGIRITDQDHVIINNYMEGLRGSTWNAGITWVAGNTASGGTSSGYQYVDNVIVAFNTLYDCTQSINMNRQSGTRAPVNSVMANNLVYSIRGELIQGDEALSPAGITFSGNLMAGSSVGYSSSGIETANPEMAQSDNLWRPSASGPADDSAAGTYPDITTDIEGRGRPEQSKDIGAVEVSGATGAAIYRPFTDEDVAVQVGCSFLSQGTQEPNWAGFPITAEQDGYLIVDTGLTLGILWISGDWVYSETTAKWAWLPESHALQTGIWVHWLD